MTHETRLSSSTAARTLFILLAVGSLGLGICRHYLPGLSVAVAQKSDAAAAIDAGSLPTPVPADAAGWRLFRGDSLASGVAQSDLPDQLKLLWKFPVENGAFESTPVVADGVAYLGDLDGKFYALDLATGKERWTFTAPESGFNAPAAIGQAAPGPEGASRDAANKLLYVGDTSGRFYCLDAQTGKQRWSFQTEAEINNSANFYKDTVLIGSQDATLYCFKADTGEEVWRYSIEDQIRCMPTVVADFAFVAGCDGKMHVIDLIRGESVGGVEIDGPTGSTPAVLGEMAYFGTEGGTFFAINWKKLEVGWKFRDEKRTLPYRSSAAVTPEAVIVGSRDKTVRAFNPTSGDELWTFPTRGRVDSSPVVVGSRVYFGSADGRVYALDRSTGKKTWEYEAGGTFIGSPAVADGRLLIASDDGNVYCFGAK